MTPVSHHFLLRHMSQMDPLMIYTGDSQQWLESCSSKCASERAVNNLSFTSHLGLLDTFSILSQNDLC